MCGVFLKIKEDNITHHDFHEEFKKPYNLYNIFSPQYQSLDNCRQDIIPSMYDKISNEAKNNSDKNFLIILDAGEHFYQGEPSVDSKMKNLFVFNRKFHCANREPSRYRSCVTQCTPPSQNHLCLKVVITGVILCFSRKSNTCLL